MKQNLKWKIIFIIGICPFVLPFIIGVYKISIESWSMIDWLIVYSFIYWPSYIIGLVLILISIHKW